jgi:intergrase/recombinase
MKIEILLETCVKKVNICVVYEPEEKEASRIRISPELKNEFYNWMLKRISEETAKKYVRLIDNLSLTEIREQYDRVKDKRNFAKAIRKFLSYLNETGHISDSELKSLKKLVPIPKTNADNNIPSDDDIREAFCYFSMMRKDLFTVAKLLLYSGARARHVVKMINSFNKRNLVRVDDFARYNLDIDNNTKKAYCIYFPAELVNDLKP